MQPASNLNPQAALQEKPVDPVFAQETKWTEPVAVAQAGSDLGECRLQQVAKVQEADDFWQDYGLAESSA